MVGSAPNSDNRTEAVVWTAEDGMRALEDVLENDYGTVMVGYGKNPEGIREAWIVNLNCVPASGKRAAECTCIVAEQTWEGDDAGSLTDPAQWPDERVPDDAEQILLPARADPYFVTSDPASFGGLRFEGAPTLLGPAVSLTLTGDTCEIVTAAALEGAFATIELPAGVELTLTYEPTRVVATVGAVTVAAEPLGDEALPTAFALAANYPNPFNPTTTIRYALPEAAPVRLVVYDLYGREVMTLVDGPQAAGRHAATFDASGLASGAYLYRLEAGPYRAVRTMLLVK